MWWVPIFLSQGRGLVFDPQGGASPPPSPPLVHACVGMMIFFFLQKTTLPGFTSNFEVLDPLRHALCDCRLRHHPPQVVGGRGETHLPNVVEETGSVQQEQQVVGDVAGAHHVVLDGACTQ